MHYACTIRSFCTCRAMLGDSVRKCWDTTLHGSGEDFRIGIGEKRLVQALHHTRHLVFINDKR